MGTLDHLKLSDTGLPGRVLHLLDAPAELLLPERLLMYSLVRGLRPERCLEIGTHVGRVLVCGPGAFVHTPATLAVSRLSSTRARPEAPS